jgi:hypothetical protein
MAGHDLDPFGLLRQQSGIVMRGVGLSRLGSKLKLMLPVLVHRVIHIIINRGRCAILEVVGSEVGGSRGKSAGGEVAVMGEVVCGLGVMRVMV